MEKKSYLKIPQERIGVLIGPDGRVKKRIEKAFGATLNIDSESGSVEIILDAGAKDVAVIFTVQNIVKAVGRGFSPDRAQRLMDEDYDLIVIDLEEYAGRSKNALDRIRGRIIGKGGKSRDALEELTETMISVYGGTVAIIGKPEMLEVAREAVLMLVKGAFHKTVWNYLYAQRRRLKKERIEIWEGQPEPKTDAR